MSSESLLSGFGRCVLTTVVVVLGSCSDPLPPAGPPESTARPDTATLVGLPALGARHSCALYSDGKVYCWGSGVLSPRAVVSTVRFDAVGAGGDQTCARSGTELYCWGRGGAVPGGESTAPRRLQTNFSFSGQVSVGRDHACVLAADGAAYCWGDNSVGQLGTGDNNVANTPTPVLTGERFTSLRAGSGFTCGVTTSNKVYCWGANEYGQLGRGYYSVSQSRPDAVTNMFGGILSSGAGDHVCNFTGGGPAAWCWGRNDAGQFGDGIPTTSATPRGTPGGAAVTTKTGTCQTDGKAGWCFGSIAGYEYNLDVLFVNGRSMAGGEQHVCASLLRFDGPPSGLYCWGDNSFGQLGDGTIKSSRTPVYVKF